MTDEDLAFWLENWFSNLSANRNQGNINKLMDFVAANRAGLLEFIQPYQIEQKIAAKQAVIEQETHIDEELVKLGAVIIEEDVK